jgi:nucleotide-binding universal stress UspA family protein
MVEKILFPVDFSPACVAMAAFVKKAETIFSAKISLLYVLGLTTTGYELLVRPATEAADDRAAAARTRLGEFLLTEFPEDENTRLLRVGDAAAQIAEVVRDHRFDMIMMPSHAGVFRRTLLGSTTAKVLNDADCPVFTTQHAETITPRPLEHREWLCAVGLQADSERVLGYSGGLAKSVGANLTLVHALAAHEAGAELEFDLAERVQAAERRAAWRRIDTLQKVAGTHAEAHIVVGPVKDALTETARRLRSDVLIIGRSPQAGVRLRDLTYAVVRDAPCPVLSV